MLSPHIVIIKDEMKLQLWEKFSVNARNNEKLNWKEINEGEMH